MRRRELAATAAFLLLLGLGIVARATLDAQNASNAHSTPTAQLTFYATNNLGYLEFMGLANQSGDRILTQNQTLQLNVSQTYIILFVPYDANTQFERWSATGIAALFNSTAYMTNLVIYGDTTLVAVATNPAVSVPEFPSGVIVFLFALASALIFSSVHGRKTPASSATRHHAPQKLSRLCRGVRRIRRGSAEQTSQRR